LPPTNKSIVVDRQLQLSNQQYGGMAHNIKEQPRKSVSFIDVLGTAAAMGFTGRYRLSMR
jgi:hypothetical protein